MQFVYRQRSRQLIPSLLENLLTGYNEWKMLTILAAIETDANLLCAVNKDVVLEPYTQDSCNQTVRLPLLVKYVLNHPDSTPNSRRECRILGLYEIVDGLSGPYVHAASSRHSRDQREE